MIVPFCGMGQATELGEIIFIIIYFIIILFLLLLFYYYLLLVLYLMLTLRNFTSQLIGSAI